MTGPTAIIRVQAEPFRLADEIASLGWSDGGTGAIASFEGLCRDENGALEALELEHYPAMAERQLSQIAHGAANRFSLNAVLVIHRHGRILPGEIIVGVACASRHRDAAFDGCRFIMDFLKTDAPFWKKEHRKGGATEWVDAREKDDAARKRWQT